MPSSENLHTTPNLLKVFISYLGFSIIPSAVRFLLLPVYISYLSPSDYGELAMLNILIGLYGVVGSLQLNISAGIEYFKVKNKVSYKQTILTSSLILSSLSFLGFIVLGFFFFEDFLKSEGISFFPKGLIVLARGYLSHVLSVFMIFEKNEYRVNQVAKYSLVLAFLSMALQYALIVIFELGVLGSIYGSLIAIFITVAWAVTSNTSAIKRKIDRQVLRSSLLIGIPFIPEVFLNWFQNISDRFFLERLLDLEEVGKYALLMNLLMFSIMIAGKYVSAVRPELYKRFADLKNNANTLAIEQIISWHNRLSMIILSGLILLGSCIILFSDNLKYHEVIPYFPIGALAILPQLLIYIPRLQIMYAGNTRIIPLYTFFSILVQCGIFLLFIPRYGIEAALVAVGVANYLNLALCYFGAKRAFRLGYNFRKQLRIIVAASLAVLIVKFSLLTLSDKAWLFGIVQFAAVLLVILLQDGDEVKSVLKKLVKVEKA